MLFSLAASSGAEVKGTTSRTPAPAAFVRLEDSARALPELAAAVARLEVGEPSLVAVAQVNVSAELAIGKGALDTLRGEIRKNVASSVKLAKIQVEEALEPGEARRRARRAGLPLVLLAPAIKAGDLYLEVTVAKWPRNFWRRALSPEGVTTAVLRLRVGAESLRGLFPAAKAILSRKSISKSPLVDPVALACGDIDEDGRVEVAVVGRHSLVLGTLDGDSFREFARRNWEDLSTVFNAPLRAPLAAARIEGKILTVGSSDRAQTVHLDAGLQLLGYSLRGYPLSGGGCLSYFPEGGLANEFNCKKPQKSAPQAGPAPAKLGEQQLDAYAADTFLSTAGVPGSITTALPLGKSEATVELSLPSEQLLQLKLPQAGSAIVAADLDGNGTAEIVSSSASNPGTPDHLRVHTIRNGTLEKVAELDAPSISALALCPFAGENPLTLVMATGQELWILK